MAWTSIPQPGQGQEWGTPALGGVLGYPKLSKELLKKVAPNWVFRRYINKVTDFTRGQHDHIIFNRMTSGYSETWQELGEYDAVPNIQVRFKRFSIKVKEYGVAIPYTERVELFSQFDVENIIRQYLGDITSGSIDKQIVNQAIRYCDIVAKKTSGGGLVFVEGKGVGVSKTFASETQPITVDPVSVAGDTPAYITVQDILAVKAEMIRRRMILQTASVIINTTLFQRLFQDDLFKQVIAFSRAERFEQGELGSIMGFKFIVDNTGYLDNILHGETPTDSNCVNKGFTASPGDEPSEPYNSIAVFLASDGIREAIALPETVRTDLPLELGRFTRVGVITYRGESPLWFTSDTDVTPPRPSGGIILIGK